MRSTHLYQHERTHQPGNTTTKSYNPQVCDKCGQIFVRKKDLEEHILLHLEVRPHQCPLCSKTFVRKRIFRQHMKIHTGDRSYCSECDKSFSRYSDYQKHYNRDHLGVDTTAKCDTCSKTLTTYRGLKLHMKQHPMCAICEQYFLTDIEMHSHVATEH